MSSIVDPDPDGNSDARRLTGRITRRDGGRPIVDSPEDIAAMLVRDDPEQFCPDCFAGMESSEHHEKCVAPLDDEDEVDCGHHSWAGLMRLLDEHWPDDIFPTRDDDDPKRDAGPRIVSLMRWVDDLRSDTDDERVRRVRALHCPDPGDPQWCPEDGFGYPCGTVRALDEGGDA